MCLSHHCFQDNQGQRNPTLLQGIPSKQHDVQRCSTLILYVAPFLPSLTPVWPSNMIGHVRPGGSNRFQTQLWFMLRGRSGQTRVGISLHQGVHSRQDCIFVRQALSPPPPHEVAQQLDGSRGMSLLRVYVVSYGCSRSSCSLSVLIFQLVLAHFISGLVLTGQRSSCFQCWGPGGSTCMQVRVWPPLDRGQTHFVALLDQRLEVKQDG